MKYSVKINNRRDSSQFYVKLSFWLKFKVIIISQYIEEG